MRLRLCRRTPPPQTAAQARSTLRRQLFHVFLAKFALIDICNTTEPKAGWSTCTLLSMRVGMSAGSGDPAWRAPLSPLSIACRGHQNSVLFILRVLCPTSQPYKFALSAFARRARRPTSASASSGSLLSGKLIVSVNGEAQGAAARARRRLRRGACPPGCATCRPCVRRRRPCSRQGRVEAMEDVPALPAGELCQGEMPCWVPSWGMVNATGL